MYFLLFPKNRSNNVQMFMYCTYFSRCRFAQRWWDCVRSPHARKQHRYCSANYIWRYDIRFNFWLRTKWTDIYTHTHRHTIYLTEPACFLFVISCLARDALRVRCFAKRWPDSSCCCCCCFDGVSIDSARAPCAPSRVDEQLEAEEIIIHLSRCCFAKLDHKQNPKTIGHMINVVRYTPAIVIPIISIRV